MTVDKAACPVLWVHEWDEVRAAELSVGDLVRGYGVLTGAQQSRREPELVAVRRGAGMPDFWPAHALVDIQRGDRSTRDNTDGPS